MVDDYVGGEENQADLFNALADPYQRATMAVLVDADGPLTLAEIAVAIVTQADDCPTTAEDLHLRLRHIHAPALADAGLLTLDSRQESVRCQVDPQHIKPLLR